MLSGAFVAAFRDNVETLLGGVEACSQLVAVVIEPDTTVLCVHSILHPTIVSFTVLTCSQPVLAVTVPYTTVCCVLAWRGPSDVSSAGAVAELSVIRRVVSVTRGSWFCVGGLLVSLVLGSRDEASVTSWELV